MAKICSFSKINLVTARKKDIQDLFSDFESKCNIQFNIYRLIC